MTTKTLRLSEELVAAIRQVGKLEAIEDASAMRKLLRMGRSLPETVDALADLGVKGNTSADDTLASLRSVRTR